MKRKITITAIVEDGRERKDGELFGQPVVKVRTSSQGSWIQRLGGSSERTKELRSVTPLGFAYAFAKANSWGST
jgi:hypothetical protein